MTGKKPFLRTSRTSSGQVSAERVSDDRTAAAQDRDRHSLQGRVIQQLLFRRAAGPTQCMMLSQREFDVFKLLLHTARERKIEIVAAQQAAVAMVDSLAADLKGSGVRANSILPSIIDTAANRKAMPDADFSKWPKPREIANVILFLCSEEAKLVHGRDIPV